jgi:hypothetical protein
MRRDLSLFALALLTCDLSLIGFGQGTTLSRPELQPAAEKTLQAQSEGAVIKRFVTERENRKTTYDAEMMVDGHAKDLQVAEDRSCFITSKTETCQG